jgi:hypothetical protein
VLSAPVTYNAITCQTIININLNAQAVPVVRNLINLELFPRYPIENFTTASIWGLCVLYMIITSV